MVDKVTALFQQRCRASKPNRLQQTQSACSTDCADMHVHTHSCPESMPGGSAGSHPSCIPLFPHRHCQKIHLHCHCHKFLRTLVLVLWREQGQRGALQSNNELAATRTVGEYSRHPKALPTFLVRLRAPFGLGSARSGSRTCIKRDSNFCCEKRPYRATLLEALNAPAPLSLFMVTKRTPSRRVLA